MKIAIAALCIVIFVSATSIAASADHLPKTDNEIVLQCMLMLDYKGIEACFNAIKVGNISKRKCIPINVAKIIQGAGDAKLSAEAAANFMTQLSLLVLEQCNFGDYTAQIREEFWETINILLGATGKQQIMILVNNVKRTSCIEELAKSSKMMNEEARNSLFIKSVAKIKFTDDMEGQLSAVNYLNQLAAKGMKKEIKNLMDAAVDQDIKDHCPPPVKSN